MDEFRRCEHEHIVFEQLQESRCHWLAVGGNNDYAALGEGFEGIFLLDFLAGLEVDLLKVASDPCSHLDAFNRVALYLGVFALVTLCARRAGAAQWSDGVALGNAAAM